MGREILKNVTFDEIKIGGNASLVHVVLDDIALFATVSRKPRAHGQFNSGCRILDGI